MNLLYVIDQHQQLLQLWRSQNATGLNIAHLDFHCDMRGLLIDREAQVAYPINSLERVDEGNYLTHAIMERRVQGICWTYNSPGGRQYDVGTVKYTTDLTAQPLRLFLHWKDQNGIPIRYEVMEFSEWNGLKAGDFLDIDWDFFSSKEYPIDSIGPRIEAFLMKDFKFVPHQISVCYSPGYSHPSRELFEAFVLRLAEKFQAKIVRVPVSKVQASETTNKPHILKRCFQWCHYQCRHIHYETTLRLRKKGIF